MAGRVMSRKRAVLIVTSCFLHNLLVSLSGDLLKYYFSSTFSPSLSHSQNILLLKWPPEYWLAIGSVFGCIMSSLLTICCGQKILLNILRPFLALWPVIYYQSEYTKQNMHSYRQILMTTAFVLQGIIDTTSQIGIPVYILEIMCGTPVELTPILLLTTQLPWRLSKSIQHSIIYVARFLQLYEFGFIFLYIIVNILFLLVPGSKGHNCDKYIGASEISNKYKAECLRPFLVCTGIILLVRLAGSDIYQFYAYWSYKPITSDHHRLINSSLIAGSCLVLVILSCAIKGAGFIKWMCVITTLLMSGCLFTTGWIISSSQFPLWLPLALHIVFNVTYTAGLGSLYIPICASLAGSKRKLIFTSVAFTYTLVGYLMSGGATIALIDFLQPFGVFWLHSTITFIGVIYFVCAVGPQISYYAKEEQEVMLIQEFVTQV